MSDPSFKPLHTPMVHLQRCFHLFCLITPLLRTVGMYCTDRAWMTSPSPSCYNRVQQTYTSLIVLHGAYVLKFPEELHQSHVHVYECKCSHLALWGLQIQCINSILLYSLNIGFIYFERWTPWGIHVCLSMAWEEIWSLSRTGHTSVGVQGFYI